MIYYKKLRLKTHPEVYAPEEDSFLLAESMNVPEGSKTLDIGTGTGIVALCSAEHAKKAVGVDINPHAIELARENATLNNREENTEFIESDLFENVLGLFDVITFNPPYLPVNEEGLLAKAWSGGEEGLETIKRFISDAGKHLHPTGSIFLLASSVNNMERLFTMLDNAGFSYSIVSTKKLFFEELYVIRCRFSLI